jgi:hypothetical protein
LKMASKKCSDLNKARTAVCCCFPFELVWKKGDAKLRVEKVGPSSIGASTRTNERRRKAPPPIIGRERGTQEYERSIDHTSEAALPNEEGWPVEHIHGLGQPMVARRGEVDRAPHIQNNTTETRCVAKCRVGLPSRG